MRHFFAPDKEKCEAFLRTQKNVVEQNTTKGVPALSARPTGGLRSPSRRRRRTVTDLLRLQKNYFSLKNTLDFA